MLFSDLEKEKRNKYNEELEQLKIERENEIALIREKYREKEAVFKKELKNIDEQRKKKITTLIKETIHANSHIYELNITDYQVIAYLIEKDLMMEIDIEKMDDSVFISIKSSGFNKKLKKSLIEEKALRLKDELAKLEEFRLFDLCSDFFKTGIETRVFSTKDIEINQALDCFRDGMSFEETAKVLRTDNKEVKEIFIRLKNSFQFDFYFSENFDLLS
jgi:hypothetical protein